MDIIISANTVGHYSLPVNEGKLSDLTHSSIPDPQSDPQNVRSSTTSVVLGVPHGFVSR